MSEDTDSANNDSTSTSTTTHTTRKTKKEEIFGFPKDDVTLGLAAAAGVGVLGLGATIVYNMMQEGKIPNPFAPNNPRISYSDVYEQQRAQQEWEAQQQQVAQAQQVQHQPQLQRQPPEGGDAAAQTMPAYTAEEFDLEGEQFSTSPPKKTDRFNRINGG